MESLIFSILPLEIELFQPWGPFDKWYLFHAPTGWGGGSPLHDFWVGTLGTPAARGARWSATSPRDAAGRVRSRRW